MRDKWAKKMFNQIEALNKSGGLSVKYSPISEVQLAALHKLEQGIALTPEECASLGIDTNYNSKFVGVHIFTSINIYGVNPLSANQEAD